MRYFLPFLTYASYCSALVVSYPNANNRLLRRAGDQQQLTNPDNEPGFINPITGQHTPASRVLSGLPPPEAQSRLFDWDESCADAGQREKITEAFQNSRLLASSASRHLQALKASLPVPTAVSKFTQQNRAFIMGNDPAYTQMFNGLDNRIDYVQETFDIVHAKSIEDRQTRGGTKPGSLRFVCNADNKIKNFRGDAPLCSPEQHAQTELPFNPAGFSEDNPPFVEPKYLLQRSSSIVFCPLFFDDTKHPGIASFGAVSKDNNNQRLDRLDCRERIMLHEYTHLEWIRDYPGTPDYIGYEDTSKYSTKGWNNFKFNADNYAWFSLYAFFNSGAGGCDRDVWPDGVRKPKRSGPNTKG